jgi:hypothetical protein
MKKKIVYRLSILFTHTIPINYNDTPLPEITHTRQSLAMEQVLPTFLLLNLTGNLSERVMQVSLLGAITLKEKYNSIPITC